MELYILEVISFITFMLLALDSIITAFLLRFTWSFKDGISPRGCSTLHAICGTLCVIAGLIFFVIGPIYVW